MSSDPDLGPLEPLADAVAERVVERLEGERSDLNAGVKVPGDADPEPWCSRIWTVAPETRLDLEAAAEALGCSARTVRRHVNDETTAPRLPASKGPMGLTVKAVDLRRWIEDGERAEQFREAS